MPALLTSTSIPPRAVQLLNHPRADLDLTKVGMAGLAPASKLLDLGGHAPGAVLVAMPGDSDVKPAAGERDRRRTANAAVASGHDRDGHGSIVLGPPGRSNSRDTSMQEIASAGAWRRRAAPAGARPALR